jgi:hypothetical protein
MHTDAHRSKKSRPGTPLKKKLIQSSPGRPNSNANQPNTTNSILYDLCASVCICGSNSFHIQMIAVPSHMAESPADNRGSYPALDRLLRAYRSPYCYFMSDSIWYDEQS